MNKFNSVPFIFRFQLFFFFFGLVRSQKFSWHKLVSLDSTDPGFRLQTNTPIFTSANKKNSVFLLVKIWRAFYRLDTRCIIISFIHGHFYMKLHISWMQKKNTFAFFFELLLKRKRGISCNINRRTNIRPTAAMGHFVQQTAGHSTSILKTNR